MEENDLLQYLVQHNIQYTYIIHPPVYTCEQADIYTNEYAGTGTKNLFLVSHDLEKYYLLMTLTDVKVDFKLLGKSLNHKKIKFASVEDSKKFLGVEPGSVSVFCVVNDGRKCVEVLIDKQLNEYELIQSHPLVNTATIIVSLKNIEEFLQAMDVNYRIMEIPKK